MERLRSWGVNVQGVSVRDDVTHPAPLDLLPSEQHGERESARERMAQRALLFAVAVLVILVLVLPAWQKRETVKALLPMVARERQEAESTDAIARELEKQVGDHNFLLARKYGTYPVLALIEEVSRLLPDNTWVQQLDVKTVGKAREVQVAGETSSSSRLIEVLEQSSLLRNATPRGTITHGSMPNTERFVIAAEVRGRSQPDAIPVLEAASAPSASANAGIAAAPPTAPANATLPSVTPAGPASAAGIPATGSPANGAPAARPPTKPAPNR